MRKLLVSLVLILAVYLPVAYAHTSDFKLVNATVTGLGDIGRDFEFLDGKGKLRRLSELNGNVVAVFFGFTNCPDVCPGFLAKANVISEQLGYELQKQFKVVFVTIDPQRDTRQVLNDYLRLFDTDSNIIGARVPGGKLPQLTRDFAIANQVIKDANGQISISHSIGAFLFDTHSTAIAYLPGNRTAIEITTEIRKLLDTQ